MRTWKEVLKEAEQKEIEALNAGLIDSAVQEVLKLREEAEELKPVVRYQTYRFDNGAYHENSVVNTKIITSVEEAEAWLDGQGAHAMECRDENGNKQLIQVYNIDGEWHTLILDGAEDRTLQSIMTEWARALKRTIKGYGLSRYSKHEAVYNEDFETVSFS